MTVIGIDPGPSQSGYVVLRDNVVEVAANLDNGAVRRLLRDRRGAIVAIEQVRSYGMAVGAEVFETCVESGRFQEAAGGSVLWVPRLEVKMHLCHDSKAKDTNIRAALLDRFGPGKDRAIGNKKALGPLYAVSGHAWAALAVAIVAADRYQQMRTAA